MALRAGLLRKFSGIRTIGRERQRHRAGQPHDGIGGLGGADAEAADDDGDDRHLCGLGLIEGCGIGGEGFEILGRDRDHAVAGFFQEPRVGAGHRRRRGGAGIAFGLVASRLFGDGGVAANHDVLALAARAIDDGDGAVLAGRGLLGLALGRMRRGGGGRGAFSSAGFWRIATWATGSPPSGLSPKMAKPAKVTRIRPSTTASACMPVNGRRNRRLRRAVCCPSGALRSSAVSAIRGPKSMADDTTAGSAAAVRHRRQRSIGNKQKGRPVRPPFSGTYRPTARA